MLLGARRRSSPGQMEMVDALAQLGHFQEDAREALTFSPREPTFFLQEMRHAIGAYHREEVQPLLHDPSRCWIVRVGRGLDGRAVLRLYYCKKHCPSLWWAGLSPREAQVSRCIEHCYEPATSVLGPGGPSAEDVLRSYYDREHGMQLEALEGKWDCSSHYTLSFDLAAVRRRAEEFVRVELRAPELRYVGDLRVAFATLARATRLDAGALSTVLSFLPSYFESLRH